MSVNALKIPAALVNFVGCGSVVSVDFVSIVGASIIAFHGVLRVRTRAGAGDGTGTGRRWVAVIRSGRLLLDQDTVSGTIGRNDGYHTTVFVRTTRAFGTRRELRVELRAVDRGDLRIVCESESDEYHSLHVPGLRQNQLRFRLHSLATC